VSSIRLTRNLAISQNLCMQMPSGPHVERAHKTDDGVLVYFDDGTIAFFPSSLLCTLLPQAIFPQAIEFIDTDDEE
jgi:hypothetical protein